MSEQTAINNGRGAMFKSKRYDVVRDLPKNYRQCSRCKRVFANRFACFDHIQAKHEHGEPIAYIRPKDKEDYEPSMAELMVEAEISRACDEPVEDWLLDMLP